MFFSKIKIDNLNEIQHEILNTIDDFFQPLDTAEAKFHSANQKIKVSSKNLNNFLKSLKLYDRWIGTGLSLLKNNSLSIHTDSINPNRIFALNIPIINCQNSYTVWYDPIPNSKPVLSYYRSNESPILSYEYNKNEVIEVARLESNVPAFVNVKLPHSAVSTSQSPRLLISLRFHPDLTEEEVYDLSS